MARDADALKIEKWAATGDVQDPEDGGLSRSIGWDATFSQPGGPTLGRAVFNELVRELTALGMEANAHGLLEWDESVSYVHPATVMDSDGRLYVSVYHSTGIDPVSDTAETAWTLFQPVGPQGPDGPQGSAEAATFENLNANGDVGTIVDQVAQGSHTH